MIFPAHGSSPIAVVPSPSRRRAPVPRQASARIPGLSRNSPSVTPILLPARSLFAPRSAKMGSDLGLLRVPSGTAKPCTRVRFPAPPQRSGWSERWVGTGCNPFVTLENAGCHPVGGCFIVGVGEVGVDVQRHAHVGVPESPTDDLHPLASGERCSDVAVANVVKTDRWELPR